jgi:heat shock protein HslJ
MRRCHVNVLALGTCLLVLVACGRGGAGGPTSGEPATITGFAWRLVAIQWADGHATRPADSAGYLFELGADGRVSGKADCNRMMGTYTIDAQTLRFGPLATTRMACPPGSVDADWLRALAAADSWLVRDGHLHITMTGKAGTIELEPAPG